MVLIDDFGDKRAVVDVEFRGSIQETIFSLFAKSADFSAVTCPQLSLVPTYKSSRGSIRFVLTRHLSGALLAARYR